jgi:hypothetical protein
MSSDPYVQGRAAQIAGTALVADGLVGLENPLNAKKSRMGIFGAMVMIAVSVVMMFVLSGMVESNKPYEGGSSVVGTVVDV